jgi:methylase of polypeptide subunit release factors
MIHLRECGYLHISRFKTPVVTPSVSNPAHEAESSVCSRCVEVGSGSGYITCSVALLLQHLGVTAHCIATDINPAALRATEQTLHAHNVSPFQVPYPLIDAALFSPSPSVLQQPY